MKNLTFRLVAGVGTLAAALLAPAAAHAEPQPRLTAAAAPATVRATPSVHRLEQHPAVLVKARAGGIDANHFIVQPPASVTWRAAPDDDSALRWAAPKGAPDDRPGKAVDLGMSARGG